MIIFEILQAFTWNIYLFSSNVDFCGYTVPHPTESKMQFRIQVTNGRAVDVLRQGLEDLAKVCDHTLEVFNKAHEQFNKSKSPMKTG